MTEKTFSITLIRCPRLILYLKVLFHSACTRKVNTGILHSIDKTCHQNGHGELPSFGSILDRKHVNGFFENPRISTPTTSNCPQCHIFNESMLKFTGLQIYTVSAAKVTLVRLQDVHTHLVFVRSCFSTACGSKPRSYRIHNTPLITTTQSVTHLVHVKVYNVEQSIIDL